MLPEWCRCELPVALEEEMGKGSPKECACTEERLAMSWTPFDRPTIDALEPTTWRGIYVVTVGAKELDRVDSGQIGASTGYDMATVAVYARTRPEDTRFILINLYMGDASPS